MNSNLRRSAFRIGCLIYLAMTTSCVTVNVGPGADSRAEHVNFVPPPRPYAEIPSKEADHTWQSEANGNTISFHSSCNESSDPSLTTMEANILRGIENLKISDERHLSYNGREALDAEASGTVDGVSVKVSVRLFKKNNCNFDLSYVAVTKHYEKDLKLFEAFLQGFVVP